MNDEIERIRQQYEKRDRSYILRKYCFSNPTFLYHMQEREWKLLQEIHRYDIELSTTCFLEVGCGTGHILQRFLDFGAHSVYGVDLIQNRLKNGQTQFPCVHFFKADAGHLPFASGSFNAVCQFMCLSSVIDSNMRMRIAQEMWRVLAPKGILISYDLRPSSLLIRAINFIGNHLTNKFSNHDSVVTTTTSPLDLEELNKLYPHGKVRIVSISLNWHLAKLARISRLLTHLLSTLPPLRSHYLLIASKNPETPYGKQ